MTTATETKQAATIAAIARYKTHAQYSASMGTRLGCFGDVNDGVLKVDSHQWEHIARRAKTFPDCERIEMGRGWHGSVDGRAWWSWLPSMAAVALSFWFDRRTITTLPHNI